MNSRESSVKRGKRGSVEALVVDASVLAPLIFVKGKDLLWLAKNYNFNVLDLTIYEVCNAFWKESTLLGRISPENAVEACSLIHSLLRYMKMWSVTDLDLTDIQRIAIENRLAFYDSSYIYLARNLNSPLATEDTEMAKIAENLGITVYRLSHFL